MRSSPDGHGRREERPTYAGRIGLKLERIEISSSFDSLSRDGSTVPSLSHAPMRVATG